MPPQLAPGTVLAGRYRLVDRLGAGGTGAVWRAHDDVLERPVAVKLLHEELELDRDVRERFRREAMAAAAIHHPHAAVVYDIGEDDGRPFLVMELVDGPALGDLMDGTPLDPGAVAAVGHQVAGALGAAHERGMAHRDVKPANVLLTLDGAAKVVDFGIAKLLGDVTQRLTSVGTVVGTAAYLAPEQLDPSADVDGRADVYALGLLLHELLTGRAPFSGATPAEVAAQRLVADGVSPRQQRPSVPAPIDAIVTTATRRDPDDRYADAAELAAALAPHVPDRPLQVVAELAHRTPLRPIPTRAITPVARAEADPERTQLIDAAVASDDVGATQVVDPSDVGTTQVVSVAAAPSPDPPPPAPRSVVETPLVDRPDHRPDAPPAPEGRRRRGLWAGVGVVALALLAAAVLSEPADRGGDGGAGAAGGTGDVQAEAAGPYRIVAATDVDPYGDGEHPEELGAAFDGDPATAWRTERYSNAAFGNLKPGVGIAFDLGESVAVSQVRLLLRSGGHGIAVHASDQPFTGTDFGEPVGTLGEAPAEAVIPVGGARGRYWLVWFTSVPGGRAEVAEAGFDRP